MTVVNERTKPDDVDQAAKPPSLASDVTVILPVRQVVLFPGAVLPIVIGRPASIAAAQEAVRSERPLGILLQTDPNDEDPTPEKLHHVGTIAQILRYVTAADGTHHVICSGTRRFRVLDFISGYPFLAAKVEEVGSRKRYRRK
jgi:ATP-dependent Lon protease